MQIRRNIHNHDPPNLLVLDESTNHLDIATKQMLIEALSQYEGTMLFISHDWHFLAALSKRMIELTPEGIHTCSGGYTEYIERTGQEAAIVPCSVRSHFGPAYP